LYFAKTEEYVRPKRGELLWALIAAIVVLAQGSVFIYRLFKSFTGDPLSLLLFDDVHISEPWCYYAGGVAVYVLAIASCLLILWSCGHVFQRWLHRRPKF
jgi:hypothetical protein